MRDQRGALGYVRVRRGDIRTRTMLLPLGFDFTDREWLAQFRSDPDGTMVAETAIEVTSEEVNYGDETYGGRLDMVLDFTDMNGRYTWELQCSTDGRPNTWVTVTYDVEPDTAR